VNRRDCLALGLALPFANPLGWAQDAARQSAVTPFAERKRKLRYAAKLGMIGIAGSLHERLAAFAALGWDGVEPDAPSDLDRDELREAARAAGLAIPGVVDSVHWRDNLADPDPMIRARGRAALETALQDAAFFGASTVLLVPAVVSQRVSYDQAWDRSREEIARVLPLAEELGVTIAFENVWNHFLLSPLEARDYVDSFESDAVAWFFDVGNVVNYGWPEQWIRTLGPRIAKLDVKEYSRSKRDAEGLWNGFAVEIGDGDCGWPEVGRALDEVGYVGWASAEVPGGDAQRLAEVLARMDRALQE
jgi:hexulose-6-phosphate isomerase